ncbi:MAG: hypothetical protein KC438_02530, partial [Thermomicrobiales bacterium]|nr:hypothetical protein [Thermomicrobiales bacterium]
MTVMLIVSMVLSVIPLEPRTAVAQSGIPVGSVVQVTTATNVRSGPCTTYPIQYTAPTGTRFTVLNGGQLCGGYRFIHVRNNSTSATGYLASELVAVVTTPVPTATRTATPLGGWSAGDLAQTTTGLNFRTGPGTTYSVIQVLPTGTQLLV